MELEKEKISFSRLLLVIPIFIEDFTIKKYHIPTKSFHACLQSDLLSTVIHLLDTRERLGDETEIGTIGYFEKDISFCLFMLYTL